MLYHNRRNHHIGTFETLEEAVRARDEGNKRLKLSQDGVEDRGDNEKAGPGSRGGSGLETHRHENISILGKRKHPGQEGKDGIYMNTPGIGVVFPRQ